MSTPIGQTKRHTSYNFQRKQRHVCKSKMSKSGAAVCGGFGVTGDDDGEVFFCGALQPRACNLNLSSR